MDCAHSPRTQAAWAARRRLPLRLDWLEQIKWDADGLVPVIAQEVGSNDVLMFAHMNREALSRTAQSGQAVYWSRSRRRLWVKGEESGHVQQVHEIRIDCDNDVVLLKVTQLGPRARHRLPHRAALVLLPALRAGCVAQRRAGLERPGHDLQVSCDERHTPSSTDTLARLAAVIESRRGGDPDKSYVARLFAKGPDAILKKIGEEATETVMAAKDGDRQRIVAEMADLWFHAMIALAAFGLKPQDVLDELARREGLSGLEEMALQKAHVARGRTWMSDVVDAATAGTPKSPEELAGPEERRDDGLSAAGAELSVGRDGDRRRDRQLREARRRARHRLRKPLRLADPHLLVGAAVGRGRRAADHRASAWASW